MADDKVERAVKAALKVSWDDLGVVEHEERLLFPDKLSRRAKSGELVEQPIMLRIIENAQRYRARIRSREWAAELKLDLERDADLVAELERFEMLAFIIRDAEPPYIQHRIDGKTLFTEYLLPELSALWARHEQLVDVVDPRFGNLNPQDVWRVIAAIAARGEPSPLAGMPGFEQATCITLMAREACFSPNAPSWLRQPSTSASDSSPQKT